MSGQLRPAYGDYLLGMWLHACAPFPADATMRHVMERAWTGASTNADTHIVIIERSLTCSYAWIRQRPDLRP